MLCVYGEYVRTKTTVFQAVIKMGQLGLDTQGLTGYEGGGTPIHPIPTNLNQHKYNDLGKNCLLVSIG